MRKSNSPTTSTLTFSSKNTQLYSPKLSSSKGFNNLSSPKNKANNNSQNRLGYSYKSATDSYKSSFVSTGEKNENAGHVRRASQNSDLVPESATLKTSINSPKYSQAVKLFGAQQASNMKRTVSRESLQRANTVSDSNSDKIQRPATGPKPIKRNLQINTDIGLVTSTSNYRSQTAKNQDVVRKSSSSPNKKNGLAQSVFDFTKKLGNSPKQQNNMTQSLQLTHSGSFVKGATGNRQSSERSPPNTASRSQIGAISRLFKPTYDKIAISQRAKPKDQAVGPSSTSSKGVLKFDFRKASGNHIQTQESSKGKANPTSSSVKFSSGFVVATEEGVTETEPNLETSESKKILNTTGSMEISIAAKPFASDPTKKLSQKTGKVISSPNGYSLKHPTPAVNDKQAVGVRPATQEKKENPKSSENNDKNEGVSLQSFVTKVSKGEIIGLGKMQQPQSSKTSNKVELTLEDPTIDLAPAKNYSKTTAAAETKKNGTAKDITYGMQLTVSAATTSATTATTEDLGLSKNDSKGTKISNSSSKEEIGAKLSPFIYYISSLEKYHRYPDESNYFSQLFHEHFLQTYQAMQFCKYMKPADPKQLQSKKVYLIRRETHKDKKTLVFDLDETLIHCNESSELPSDVKLPIKFPHGEMIEAGINVRPYALEALKELSAYFEIIVFTASHNCYANVVLDYLDPKNQYIHHRLFRDSCIQTEEGIYIKDLRVIANRNLSDLILVDNAAYSFGFQIENGIPIAPFYNNYEDKELKHLIPYLKFLAGVKDPREINRQTFKLHMYTLYDSPDKVIEKVVLNN